jgi:hypothetical protein
MFWRWIRMTGSRGCHDWIPLENHRKLAAKEWKHMSLFWNSEKRGQINRKLLRQRKWRTKRQVVGCSAVTTRTLTACSSRSRIVQGVTPSHPPMSISGSGELREILFGQKVSWIHILSIHCITMVQFLHPVEKDTFQCDFFNIPQNIPDPLKKRIQIREFTSWQRLLDGT